MIVTLSPSKTMDFSATKQLKNIDVQIPAYLKKSTILRDTMQKMSVEEIMKLMKVSEKIARINEERFKNWNTDFTWNTHTFAEGEHIILDAKPALLSFTGDVYKGFDVEKYTKKDFDFAHQHIRILSGLYGMISPLTLIKPYRLEMGTRLATQHSKNLYEFWSKDLTEDLNTELNGETWINLASVEYSKVIERKKISSRIIDIDFLTEKNGVQKNIGIFAKRQRGKMANWIIHNKITNPEDIQLYTNDGYIFSGEHSTDQRFVFICSEKK